MNCGNTRKRLESIFDAATPPDETVERHLRGCPACAHYAAALRTLGADLMAAPAVAPAMPSDLAARIKLNLAEERERQSPMPSLRWWVAIALCGVAAVAGWRYPLPWDIRLWWGHSDAWFDPDAWQALGQQFVQPFQGVWGDAAALLSQGTGLLPPSLLWGGVVVAALVLVLFNLFEARSLGDDTRRGGSRPSRG